MAGGASTKTWSARTSVPHRVHTAVGVAHAHRREGVAVVTPRQVSNRVLECLPSPPVLQRHLHRDLDRHRARITEEHLVQPGRGDLDEPRGEFDRRAVGKGRRTSRGSSRRVGRSPPRRAPGGGSRGSRPTTSSSHRRADPPRSPDTPSAECTISGATAAGIAPYGCHTCSASICAAVAAIEGAMGSILLGVVGGRTLDSW